VKDGAGLDGWDQLEAWRAELAARVDAEALAPPRLVPERIIDDVRRLATLDVTGDADDTLSAAVGDLETARRALDAATAHVVAELDSRGTTDRAEGLTTRHWLGWHHGLPRNEAASRVRIGAFLRHHHTIDAALADGRLSVDHARLLARLTTPRVAAVVAAIQEQLIDLAAGVRYETWAREVRALLDLADTDGGHDPRPEENRLTLSDGLDGTLHLHADLTGHWALDARAALDAEADRLFHAHCRDAATTGGELPVPPRHVLLAMAFVELCRRGRAATHPRSAATADVTLIIEAADGPTARRPDDDLSHWLDGLTVRTLDGTRIPHTTARILCCDPEFRLLVRDARGEVLALGRTQRLASAAQRRAVGVRDGGCCFPGCTAPPTWTDMHHVRPWHGDGPTDIANFAPLCRHHHGVVHRSGWSMRPSAGQRFDFVTPAGLVLCSQRHGRPPP
jgi:hypothetical protein